MDEEEPKKKVRVSPFAPIGWVISALSLVNIIDQLSPMELMGTLRQWVEGYTMLVDSITGFLFGWINWRWMEISAIEGHLIVVMTVLCAAVIRASFKSKQASSVLKALGLFYGVVGGVVGHQVCIEG